MYLVFSVCTLHGCLYHIICTILLDQSTFEPSKNECYKHHQPIGTSTLHNVRTWISLYFFATGHVGHTSSDSTDRWNISQRLLWRFWLQYLSRALTATVQKKMLGGHANVENIHCYCIWKLRRLVGTAYYHTERVLIYTSFASLNSFRV